VPPPAPLELGGFLFAACSLAMVLSSLGAAAEQATAEAARRRAIEMRETDVRQIIVVSSQVIESTTLTSTSDSRSSSLHQERLVIPRDFAMGREVLFANFSDTIDVALGCKTRSRAEIETVDVRGSCASWRTPWPTPLIG